MNSAGFDYTHFSRLPSKKIKHIPGDSGLPVFGDTFRLLNDVMGLSRSKYDIYGPVFRSYAFFQHTVVALGPDANEAVFKTHAGNFSNKLAWDPTLDRIFPNGLMLMDFDTHKYNRKVLQAAFRRHAIEAYIGKMSPHIRQGLQQWPGNTTMSFYPHIKSLLLDVAAEVFLGVEMGKEADQVNHAFIAAVDASTAIVKLPLVGRRWQRGLQGRQVLEQFVRGHLKHKRSSDAADFFAQISRATDDNGRLFDDQAIVDHLIFLLFAAHDTTTSTLCSIIYCLARYPQWQERLREEMFALAQDDLAFDDMAKLEQTGLVMKEALRMYSPLPVIPRRCIRPTELLGYTIPENASVGLSPLFTHYMEEYWNQPGSFDPERFSKARGEDKKHFFQYIPFGGGHHKCLGLNFAEIQTRLFLFHFLRRFKLVIEPGYRMKRSVVPLALPTDGLPVTLIPLKTG